MNWMHQVRTLPEQTLPLAQGLAHHPDLAVLEIAQTTMNDSRGTAGGAGGEVMLFKQERAFPSASTLPGNGDTVNSAANDHYVEAFTF